MKLKDEKKWNNWVEKNTDDYGKACVDVARKVMEILDKGEDYDCHDIICKADKDSNSGGITGFMAGCIAEMVSVCHIRGEDFRQKWNIVNQIGDEGKKANKSGGVINPALLTIQTKGD